jgi:hypothetical protein
VFLALPGWLLVPLRVNWFFVLPPIVAKVGLKAVRR